MKAVWYEKQGAASDVLQFGEIDNPRPGPGEVHVRVAVSGVNPVDAKRRLGGRGEMSAPRIIPHLDGSGVIDLVGEGVANTRLGERVWVYEAQGARPFGTAAEGVTVPAHCAVPLPDNTSFAEGACLGVPALTAYASVFVEDNIQGKTLLVTGGAGAVGRYAVQFAKLSGAQVIATVSNDEKAQLATSAGADHVINYRTEDVATCVQKITAGQGVDQIVEVEFGGNLDTSLQVLKPSGVIATYASQAVPEPKVPFYTLLYKNVIVRHILVLLMPEDEKQQAIVAISRWLEQGMLTHHLGQRFSLEQTVAAHEAVENGAVGKVLIEIGG
ncbi:MAG: NADPH:quinone reductase [Planctomycetes bacterium]|nr:NADPH:quinone reductase [Planctomycetota bacterium]